MNSGQCSRVVLVFDVGNSRIKWALWRLAENFSGLMDPSAWIEKGSVSHSELSLQTLMNQLQRSCAAPEEILAVNVAGESIEKVLAQWVAQAWAKPIRFLRTSERYSGGERILVNAYDDPAAHGADRWAGLIAASHEFSGALCVISAGTAITFDLLEADGRHLGGRILPSLQTMTKALLADAAEINMVADDMVGSVDEAVPALFASDTKNAINSGVHYLLVAGLREACAQAANALSQPATFIVTGGGGKQMMKWLDMPEMKYRPDLILQGVCLALNKGDVDE